MAETTTLGKMIVREVIPEDIAVDGPMDKKQTNKVLLEIARRYPGKYEDISERLIRLSSEGGTAGGDASIRLKDYIPSPKIKALQQKIRREVQEIAQNPMLDNKSRQKAIVSYMVKQNPLIEKAVMDEMKARPGSLAESVTKGLRGSPGQAVQILFGDRLMTDHHGKPIPVPGLSGYSAGVSPVEYWAGTYSARAGNAAVQFATARAGYLGKQMTMASQRVRVTGEDCGAQNVGNTVSADDPDNVGMVLARDAGEFKAGHVLSDKDLNKLGGKDITVRSHLTCQQPEGVCQKCTGIREKGDFPAIGEFVGITSSKALNEPMAQKLGLSFKHVGTLATEDSGGESLTGFDEIEQFLNLPKNFIGRASVSEIDGRVRSVTKAPQGGEYIHVNDARYYVPAGRKILVKPGEEVEAGDILSDGVPNPADIVRLKGLGEGRRYFANKFADILRNNGIPGHRRNIETFTRGMFNRVRITKPDGLLDYSPEDLVFYSDIQRKWRPREGSRLASLESSVGQYLEQPVGHYTIGTRITPKVAAGLKKAGYSALTVHKDSPGFESVAIPLANIGSQDPDWKTAAGAFDLKRNFIKAAAKGSFSPHESTSYFSSLADPTKL